MSRCPCGGHDEQSYGVSDRVYFLYRASCSFTSALLLVAAGRTLDGGDGAVGVVPVASSGSPISVYVTLGIPEGAPTAVAQAQLPLMTVLAALASVVLPQLLLKTALALAAALSAIAALLAAAQAAIQATVLAAEQIRHEMGQVRALAEMDLALLECHVALFLAVDPVGLEQGLQLFLLWLLHAE
ncbi:hypothetical protein Taro_011864 [Colocasia esculenta]|uniref:Uncharacterized protein n=1 Tax=Colocasia esculenta TaxID=4460 RepID=A0A843UC28_COLES|nr:hypothetical protein [Colocasia esculenta]